MVFSGLSPILHNPVWISWSIRKDFSSLIVVCHLRRRSFCRLAIALGALAPTRICRACSTDIFIGSSGSPTIISPISPPRVLNLTSFSRNTVNLSLGHSSWRTWSLPEFPVLVVPPPGIGESLFGSLSHPQLSFLPSPFLRLKIRSARPRASIRRSDGSHSG